MAFVNIPRSGLPPQDVKIVDALVEPYPDGRRVRVQMTLTPFLEPPSLEAVIQDTEGQVVATTSIIETAHPRLSITMHIRGQRLGGQYQLNIGLRYAENETDQRVVFFELPPPQTGEG
jgi:hypothetical protein